MSDILPVKINYTVLRIKLKQCADKYAVKDPGVIDTCINLIRRWKADGHIFDENDLDMALKSCYATIKSKAAYKLNQKKNPGTLCWSCYNACPMRINDRYISGCEWSIHLRPVEGWTADKTDVSYFVKECPKFIPG